MKPHHVSKQEKRFRQQRTARRCIRYVVFGLGLTGLIVITGCENENPTIQVSNHRNQNGGDLQITGSDFIAGNPIAVSIQNVPGGTGPWSELAGNADGQKKIDVTISYSYDQRVITLPGCQTNSSDIVTLNVTATDRTTHAFGTAQVNVPNCGWATPQVSSHQ